MKPLHLLVAALALVACDADPAQPRALGDVAGVDALDADVCAQEGLYGDGLCDPGCGHPDPDCMDCETAARLAVDAIEDLAGQERERNHAEPVTEPGVDGKQVIKVRGPSYEYLVNAQARHERAGELAGYCIVHGLQLVREQVDIRVGEPAEPQPPSDACGEAAASAVTALERQAAFGVLATDGTLFVDEDADGQLVPRATSYVSAMVLDHKESQRELIQVQVDRSAPWTPMVDVYMVNTKPVTVDGDTTCRVYGLQTYSEQVDLRD